MSNVDEIRAVTRRAVADGVRKVVFDLGELDFIDSSGITVLLEVVHQTESVLVRHPSTAARRIIEATGLTDVLRTE